MTFHEFVKAAKELYPKGYMTVKVEYNVSAHDKEKIEFSVYTAEAGKFFKANTPLRALGLFERHVAVEVGEDEEETAEHVESMLKGMCP